MTWYALFMEEQDEVVVSFRKKYNPYSNDWSYGAAEYLWMPDWVEAEKEQRRKELERKKQEAAKNAIPKKIDEPNGTAFEEDKSDELNEPDTASKPAPTKTEEDSVVGFTAENILKYTRKGAYQELCGEKYALCADPMFAQDRPYALVSELICENCPLHCGANKDTYICAVRLEWRNRKNDNLDMIPMGVFVGQNREDIIREAVRKSAIPNENVVGNIIQVMASDEIIGSMKEALKNAEKNKRCPNFAGLFLWGIAKFGYLLDIKPSNPLCCKGLEALFIPFLEQKVSAKCGYLLLRNLGSN